MTAELWHADAADEHRRAGARTSVRPTDHYGRLAVFDDPGPPGRTSTDDRVLRLFAHYAANALDVFTS